MCACVTTVFWCRVASQRHHKASDSLHDDRFWWASCCCLRACWGCCLCLQPVLECAVQRGLVYNKVNPIFHHWRVEDRKFGLTFQSPADAISFEKGLQTVIDKLDRGILSATVQLTLQRWWRTSKLPLHLIQVLTHPRPPHQRRLTQRMTDKL